MSDKTDPLDIFDALGWPEFKDAGSQKLCECPFCGKNKMYVDPKKTTFSCKVCGIEGNNITVMDRMFNEVYRKARDGKDFDKIAEYRRPLPAKAFALDPCLGYDCVLDRYVWIVRKPNGMPVSLRTWKFPTKSEIINGKKKLRKTAVHNLRGCHLGLVGAELLGEESRKAETVYICEGEWDRIALLWLLDQLDIPGIVLGLPGASNFSPQWVEWFKGRHVIGLYDNDEPGKQGTLKCQNKIAVVAKSLKFLHWDDDKRDGYDIDNLVKDNLKDLKVAWDYIQKNLKQEAAASSANAQALLRTANDRQKEQENLEPITLEQLYAVFDKWLKLQNHDLIDIVMATAWSLYLPGNPLWMFAVAPPSASKSEIIMPISAWHKVHALSSVTSRSLISGFTGQGGSDPSLLGSLQGRKDMLAIKDLTPILQGSPDERDEIFGILRDSYDGAITRMFGNGIKRDYKDLHFSIIAGVTPTIDMVNQTAFGERFLKFRSDRDTDRSDDIERAMRAISNCGSEDSMRAELRDAAIRALQRPFVADRVPGPTDAIARELAVLAQVIAKLRGVAPTERGTDIQLMSALTEAPARLATQFMKLSQGLALHYGLNSLEEPRIKRLVRRVALHTPGAIETKIAQVLYGFHSKAGMTVAELTDKAHGIGRETVSLVLRRFSRTKLSTMRKDGTVYFHRLSDDIYQMMKEVHIFDNLPKTDVYYRSDIKRAEPTMTVKVAKA